MTNLNTCSVDECGKRKHARGLCASHYKRMVRHGDPLLGGASPIATPEEAFRTRTEWRGDCLIWTAGKNAYGYGNMRVDGKTRQAHRYAWERVNGPIPEKMQVDHRCHTPACCNVAHMRLVTIKQNAENRAGAQANSTTGVRGVSMHECGKYIVMVGHHGKRHYIGLYSTLEQAEAAAVEARNGFFKFNDRDRA